MGDQGQDLLTKVGRSYVRHEHADGLEELASGVELAVLGVTLYVMGLSMRHQIDDTWFGGAVFLMLAITLTRDRVKERVRQRVTYPRIGYASAEPGEPISRRLKWIKWLIVLGVGVLVPVLIAALLFSGRLPDLRSAAELGRWIPAVCGILVGAAAWSDAERFGIKRFRVSGVIIGVVGIVASLAGADVVSASALFCMGWGVIDVTTGGVTLWRFSSAYDSGAP